MNYRNILKNTLSEKSFLMVNKKIIAKYELEPAALIAYLINQETYWRDEKGKIDFYATDNDIYLYTGINFNRIKTIRLFLIKEGVIEVELKGTPMANHYNINHKKILEIISTDESVTDIAYKKAFGEINFNSVNNMSIKKLRLVCKQKGVKYTGKDKKSVLATKIIDIFQLTENPLTSVQKSCKLVNRKVVTNLKQKQKQKKQQSESVVVISERLNKTIEKSKRNIYVSKSWNKRVDNKIIKIAEEHGEDYAVIVLNNLYKDLKMDIKKTLVQYINGIIKNIEIEKEDIKFVVKEEILNKNIDSTKEAGKVETEQIIETLSEEDIIKCDKDTDIIKKAQDIYIKDNNLKSLDSIQRMIFRSIKKVYYAKALEELKINL